MVTGALADLPSGSAESSSILPDRAIRCNRGNPFCIQPLKHPLVDPLILEAKPALTLISIAAQHCFEPAKRALALERILQLCMDLRVANRLHERHSIVVRLLRICLRDTEKSISVYQLDDCSCAHSLSLPLGPWLFLDHGQDTLQDALGRRIFHRCQERLKQALRFSGNQHNLAGLAIEIV